MIVGFDVDDVNDGVRRRIDNGYGVVVGGGYVQAFAVGTQRKLSGKSPDIDGAKELQRSALAMEDGHGPAGRQTGFGIDDDARAVRARGHITFVRTPSAPVADVEFIARSVDHGERRDAHSNARQLGLQVAIQYQQPV